MNPESAVLAWAILVLVGLTLAAFSPTQVARRRRARAYRAGRLDITTAIARGRSSQNRRRS